MAESVEDFWSLSFYRLAVATADAGLVEIKRSCESMASAGRFIHCR